MGVITRGLVTKSIVAPAQGIFVTTSINTPFTSASTVSQTPTSPITQGDLMISVISTSSVSNLQWTPPAGWTEVVDTGVLPNFHVSWKIAGSTETAAVWTPTSSCTGIAMILGFRNALIDAVGGAPTPVTGTNSFTMAAITTTANNAMVVLVTAGGTHNGFTGTSGYTTINSQINVAAIHAQYKLQPVAGSTGTQSYNFSSGTGSAVGVLLSVKPK